MREIRMHLLVGSAVRDPDGEIVGRIEELCAEIEMGEGDAPPHYVVTTFQLGPNALMDRIFGAQFARGVRAMLHMPAADRIVPWQLMDLSDPNHPRVTKRRSELPEAG